MCKHSVPLATFERKLWCDCDMSSGCRFAGSLLTEHLWMPLRALFCWAKQYMAQSHHLHRHAHQHLVAISNSSCSPYQCVEWVATAMATKAGIFFTGMGDRRPPQLSFIMLSTEAPCCTLLAWEVQHITRGRARVTLQGMFSDSQVNALLSCQRPNQASC